MRSAHFPAQSPNAQPPAGARVSRKRRGTREGEVCSENWSECENDEDGQVSPNRECNIITDRRDVQSMTAKVLTVVRKLIELKKDHNVESDMSIVMSPFDNGQSTEKRLVTFSSGSGRENTGREVELVCEDIRDEQRKRQNDCIAKNFTLEHYESLDNLKGKLGSGVFSQQAGAGQAGNLAASHAATNKNFRTGYGGTSSSSEATKPVNRKLDREGDKVQGKEGSGKQEGGACGGGGGRQNKRPRPRPTPVDTSTPLRQSDRQHQQMSPGSHWTAPTGVTTRNPSTEKRPTPIPPFPTINALLNRGEARLPPNVAAFMLLNAQNSRAVANCE